MDEVSASSCDAVILPVGIVRLISASAFASSVACAMRFCDFLAFRQFRLIAARWRSVHADDLDVRILDTTPGKAIALTNRPMSKMRCRPPS